MGKYTLRKLLALIPKVFLISVMIFVALELLPGDPLTRAVPMDKYREMSDAMKESYRESMGLNDPAPVRYLNWIGNLLKGDFGYSTSTGANIGTMIATKLPYTIELACWGVISATIIGVLTGYLAAVRKNTILDYSCTAFSVLGISVPDFFWGIVLLIIFAIKLKWLPTGGRMPVGDSSFSARFPYLIMPSLTLGIGLMAAMTRFTRNSMLDVLNKEYVKTARSKGLSETTVNVKHGFRNALIPVMTMICMRLPMLFGGSVVVETVFNYPGTGKMALDALNASDMPVVMITTMVIAVVTLVASTLVDVVTALIDPRIRLE